MTSFHVQGALPSNVPQRPQVRNTFMERCVSQSVLRNHHADNQMNSIINRFIKPLDSNYQVMAECLFENVQSLQLPTLVRQSPFTDILGPGIESLASSLPIAASCGGVMGFDSDTGTLSDFGLPKLVDPTPQVPLDEINLAAEETTLVSPMTPNLGMPQLPLRENFSGIQPDETSEI